MLLQFVQNMIGNQNTRLILSDWLEDNKSNHPDIDHYLRILRNLDQEVTIEFIIDLVLKLGNRLERRKVSKIRRRIKKNCTLYKRIYGVCINPNIKNKWFRTAWEECCTIDR